MIFWKRPKPSSRPRRVSWSNTCSNHGIQRNGDNIPRDKCRVWCKRRHELVRSKMGNKAGGPTGQPCRRMMVPTVQLHKWKQRTGSQNPCGLCDCMMDYGAVAQTRTRGNFSFAQELLILLELLILATFYSLGVLIPFLQYFQGQYK